jgi:hypothetical protein
MSRWSKQSGYVMGWCEPSHALAPFSGAETADALAAGWMLHCLYMNPSQRLFRASWLGSPNRSKERPNACVSAMASAPRNVTRIAPLPPMQAASGAAANQTGSGCKSHHGPGGSECRGGRFGAHRGGRRSIFSSSQPTASDKTAAATGQAECCTEQTKTLRSPANALQRALCNGCATHHELW